MAFLLDTGVLLRLVNKSDQQHLTVSGAVRTLIQRREELLITTQNIAEFCNVVTRPAQNNGLGIPPAEAIGLLEREIESICGVLAETDAIPGELKRLITKYDVIGKQVHDARLVAMMLGWRVGNILTINDRDFRRYEPEGIAVVSPDTFTTLGNP